MLKPLLHTLKPMFRISFKHLLKLLGDNGKEFVNHYLINLFLISGIIHQTSCPHTPEQNGVVERKHRHLMDTTLTLLDQASMPAQFWLEALLTTVFLANRLPHSSLQFQVPHVLLFHTKPDYLTLKPFGCACFPWLKPYHSHKLIPKSTTCVFLGYCTTSKGYRCFDPLTNKVYISRHVRFLEQHFPYSTLVSQTSSVQDADFQLSTFSIPLTSFSDIIVTVKPIIPSSPVQNSSVPTAVPVFDFVPFTVSVGTDLLSLPPSCSVPVSSNSVLPSSSPSSSIPPPPESFSTAGPSHSMRTRSKNGIFKPRQPLTLLTSTSFSSSSLPTTEPKHFSDAIRHYVWQKAMAEEYEALV